ncbi:Methyl-accepting chemotaxis protein [Yersinia aldovae ATCC 35236]|nr:Methyl-accepting chemotaxis protein [Yersinia aldovae ATCC 35236]
MVASEVRNLAQRSAQAAKEIEGLISDRCCGLMLAYDKLLKQEKR